MVIPVISKCCIGAGSLLLGRTFYDGKTSGFTGIRSLTGIESVRGRDLNRERKHGKPQMKNGGIQMKRKKAHPQMKNGGQQLRRERGNQWYINEPPSQMPKGD
ncbi:hypothetical protein BT96DRAFT_947340 [Gymnopus androsaceus JB14]|uniref:Uncharacterized protein n=1 Tax=Gymnopus androsaceus JB14 TaxID=1447944 RepID=A0A6A4GTZ9_9AGAR|nr:hypothetical protein BT96DRAFT_947340 [Gymnopus androsaceus JB14]